VRPTRFVVLGVSTTPVRFPPLEADFELGVGTVVTDTGESPTAARWAFR